MGLSGNAIHGTIFLFNPVEPKPLQRVILFTGNLQNRKKDISVFGFLVTLSLACKRIFRKPMFRGHED